MARKEMWRYLWRPEQTRLCPCCGAILELVGWRPEDSTGQINPTAGTPVYYWYCEHEHGFTSDGRERPEDTTLTPIIENR